MPDEMSFEEVKKLLDAYDYDLHNHMRGNINLNKYIPKQHKSIGKAKQFLTEMDAKMSSTMLEK